MRLGFIHIHSERGHDLLCRLGERAPVRTGGGPVFNEVERPNREPILEWDAAQIERWDVDLLLDGWREHRSVEGEVKTIERMMGMPNKNEPPRIHIFLPKLKPIHRKRWWVIEAAAWGENPPDVLYRHGIRHRQTVTLSIAEPTGDSVIRPAKKKPVHMIHDEPIFTTTTTTLQTGHGEFHQGPAILGQHGPNNYTIPVSEGGGVGPRGRVVARQGEDLQRIALRIYGDASKWPLLAQANRITDPASVRPGDTLRVP
jgi:hypothetical protein